MDLVMTLDEVVRLLRLDGELLAKQLVAEERLRLPGGRLGVGPESVRRLVSAAGFSYPRRRVAHVNLKGGTGKTTTTISSAVRAAQLGYRTCVIDLDSQASTSLAFGLDVEEERPIFSDVWGDPERQLAEALVGLAPGLSLLPSSLDNSLLDVQLVNPAHQKRAVARVCDALVRLGFELILIDCPPSLGAAVISTICATDTVVIPASGDAFSAKGVALTLSEVEAMCETFGVDPPRLRILFTRFDRRLGVDRELFDCYRERYGERLFNAPIRTSSDFSRALQAGETIYSSNRRSVGRDDYDRYLFELLGIDGGPVERADDEGSD